MDEHTIEIEWEGPFSVATVIKKMNNGGSSVNYFSGNDYGVYQIYGNHILCGKDTLLYVGQVSDQTFSERIKQHQDDWLSKEMGAKIYLGRLTKKPDYSPTGDWSEWRADVVLVESILVYKYAPNYNSYLIATMPKLDPYEKVRLFHKGNRNRLKKIDNAPGDYC